MDAQLRLLNTTTESSGPPAARTRRPAWHLDETTRTVGRLGVAQARAALRAATQVERDDHSNAA